MGAYYIKLNGKLLKFNDELLTVDPGGGGGGGTKVYTKFLEDLTSWTSDSPNEVRANGTWSSPTDTVNDYASWHAFNGVKNLEGKSAYFGQNNTTLPKYITIDFGVGNAKTIWKYDIVVISGNVYTPDAWTVSQSTDAAFTSPVTIDSQTGQRPWTSFEERTFELAVLPTTGYRYLRFNFTSTGDSRLAIAELDFYEYQL